MVDVQPLPPFAGALEPGRFGADGEPGVTLSEAAAMSLVHVADAAGAPLGLTLPTNAGEVATAGELRALWLGPDQWLIKAPAAPFGEWSVRIAEAAPAAAVNDVSHGRATVRIEGASARDLLAAGCPLDFHAAAFPPGRAFASLLGHLSVVIECVGADAFEVTVTRSYGRDLAQWLRHAAAEFGYRID
jgi:sarcosine oxidase subunit gamma